MIYLTVSNSCLLPPERLFSLLLSTPSPPPSSCTSVCPGVRFTPVSHSLPPRFTPTAGTAGGGGPLFGLDGRAHGKGEVGCGGGGGGGVRRRRRRGEFLHGKRERNRCLFLPPSPVQGEKKTRVGGREAFGTRERNQREESPSAIAVVIADFPPPPPPSSSFRQLW